MSNNTVRPKVSIIVPTYNVEEYIEQCLDSAIRQSLQSIEVICVDDCSSDSTTHILQEYIKTYPHIVRVIFNPKNVSASQCRKQGVIASAGEYIMFLDSDDYLELHACETAYKAIKKAKTDILHYGAIIENHANISESRITSNEKFISPYLKNTIRGNLLSACFSEKKFAFTLWNKIIRGDLCRTAFSRVEDGYFPKANDLYPMFICLDLAQSYKGIEIPLYHYCFGRGMTGNGMSLKSFAKHCQSTLIYQALSRYVERMGSERPCYYDQVLDLIKEDFFKEQCSYWFNGLDQSAKLEGFEIMCQVWEEGALFVLSKFANLLYYKREEVASSLQGIPTLSYRPREIQTIGLYYRSLRNGGIERVLAQLCNLFADYEIDGINPYKVILIIDDLPKEGEYPISSKVVREQIPHIIQFPKNNYYERAKGWYDIIDRYQIDLVISHAWFCTFNLWDMLIIKSHPSRPAYINHVHQNCGAAYLLDNGIISEMWSSYSLADGVVTLSRYDQRFWSYVNPNSYYIPNPCYIETKDEYRAKFDGKTITWIGRIAPEKQPQEIVGIMRYVLRDIPNAICYVVGEGYEHVKKNLVKLIKENQLENHILLVGYTVDPSKYYQESSVFLSTSAREGFPLTFFESAAHGLPTVTYDIPWIEYYNIIDGWCTVPQKAPKEAAKEIIKLLKDQEYWQEKSNKLFKSFKKFQKEDPLEQWIKLVKGLETGVIPKNVIDPQDGLILKQITDFHSLKIRQMATEKRELQRKYSDSFSGRWARFRRLSWKKKILVMGKVISKKLHIYRLLRPFYKIIKKGFEKIR